MMAPRAPRSHPWTPLKPPRLRAIRFGSLNRAQGFYANHHEGGIGTGGSANAGDTTGTMDGTSTTTTDTPGGSLTGAGGSNGGDVVSGTDTDGSATPAGGDVSSMTPDAGGAEGGCGCRLQRQRSDTQAGLALLFALLVLGHRRRSGRTGVLATRAR